MPSIIILTLDMFDFGSDNSEVFLHNILAFSVRSSALSGRFNQIALSESFTTEVLDPWVGYPSKIALHSWVDLLIAQQTSTRAGQSAMG